MPPQPSAGLEGNDGAWRSMQPLDIKLETAITLHRWPTCVHNQLDRAQRPGVPPWGSSEGEKILPTEPHGANGTGTLPLCLWAPQGTALPPPQFCPSPMKLSPFSYLPKPLHQGVPCQGRVGSAAGQRAAASPQLLHREILRPAGMRRGPVEEAEGRVQRGVLCGCPAETWGIQGGGYSGLSGAEVCL